jgi:hypothetical protein
MRYNVHHLALFTKKVANTLFLIFLKSPNIASFRNLAADLEKSWCLIHNAHLEQILSFCEI